MSAFPVNPAVGQIWTAPNGFQYRWTAKGTWRRVNTKEALLKQGAIMQAAFGTSPFVDGFVAVATPTPSMQVVLNPGSIFSQGALEQNEGGTIHSVNKLAVLLDPILLPRVGTFAQPTTAGQSINYLVQVGFADSLNTPQDNPNNDAIRMGRVNVNIKQGTPAPTGTQGTPAVDSGYVGVAVVTVDASSSAIIATQIRRPLVLPSILDKLPDLPAAIQAQKYTFAKDTGTADNYVIRPNPPLRARTEGLTVEMLVKSGNSNLTGNPVIDDGVGGSAFIVRRDGTPPTAGDIAGGTSVRLRVDANGNYRLVNVTVGEIAQIAQGAVPGSPTVPTTSLVPPGLVGYFGTGSSPPNGWLYANGAAVSRISFAALFNVIGTTFGAGDGSSTFNLPDLRGVFLRGHDNGRGIDNSGRAFGTLQADAFRAHNHPPNNSGAYITGYGAGAGSANVATGAYLQIDSSATVGGAETRPYNVALLPIIKY